MNKNHKLLLPVLTLALGVTTAANADTLTTTFAETNIAGSGWTNLFDLTVSNAGGVKFTDFTVDLVQNGGGVLDIYVRPTTYVGFETTMTGWTLISSGTSTGLVNAGADKIDVTDFTLQQGTYGFALVNTNYQVGFTTPASDYGNGDLSIDNGAMVTGALAGGISSSSSIWNGTITYDVVPEPATLALLAFGALPLLRRRRSGR